MSRNIEIKYTKVIDHESLSLIEKSEAFFFIVIKLFINNEFVDGTHGRTFSTYCPSTEEKIVDVAEADIEDVDKAVQAAKLAFELESEWRSMDASERGRIIFKFAQLIRRDLDYLTVIYEKLLEFLY